MCGINLCFGEKNIDLMNSLLDHRGIRSNKEELTNDLFLGHVRLPIQGLSTQDDHPITYHNITGAFVGEIYNYKEMSASASSDLPILLLMFRLMGTDAFRHFDGMWSAILYDRTERLIHVITDPLAKKPLYIRQEPFAISSEIKSLLQLGENTFDEIYFSAVGKWGYCPEPRTPFNEISAIPQGAHIIIDSRNGVIMQCDTYMSIEPPKKQGDLLTILKKAVELRTVSDVPISLLMSGGLDSTILYYLLRNYKDVLTIFHVENDEAQYLEYVDFRPQDKLITIDFDQGYNLDKVLWHNDGPVDLGSMVPQYLLAREIKKHGFNVCLSGDGADELFGGYKRINKYDSQYSDIYHELIYYHLPRLDKMTMAHTVELRCPFLAWTVLGHALGLPYRERINKKALKDAVRGIVPDEIIDRVKQPLRYRREEISRFNLIDHYRELIKKEKLV